MAADGIGNPTIAPSIARQKFVARFEVVECDTDLPKMVLAGR